MTLKVPGYKQARNYSCGYAAAFMVLRYFKNPLQGQALFHLLGTATDGTGQTSIVRALRKQGVRVSVRYDIGFENLCKLISAEKLLLGYLENDEHWVVIYGYGRNPKRVFVADPLPATPCEHLWELYGHRLNGFAMVCSKATSRCLKANSSKQLAFDF